MSKWERSLLGNSNVQQFSRGSECFYAPVTIGNRYEIDGILSVSGGFGIIFTAEDRRLLGRRVLVKARRYDGEAGLFSYANDTTRREQIEKKRKEIQFEYNCLLNFRTQGESRMPNVNDIVLDYSPFIYGPHKDVNGNTYCYEEPEIYNTEPYIIMQMIEGVNLGEYLSQGIDNLLKDRGYNSYKEWEKDVLQYALELCTIFSEFHRKDTSQKNKFFIYQDLKPDNIMITDNVFITLIDFGGMTLVTEENGVTFSNWKGYGSPGLGTPGYKAPEMGDQSLVSKLDQRVDVYTLGATLYHLLTGDDLSKGVHKEYGPIPIENLKKFGCIKETYELVYKATRADREERYSNMKEVRSQIYEALKSIKRV